MMKFYLMLAIVYVASAKNLNTKEDNEREHYIDYNQNSNDTEEIYGSSKFSKAALDSFAYIEQLYQRFIDKDVENTTLSNIDEINKATTTEAPPVELNNKTLINSLNDTDAIDVDNNNNKPVPIEPNILLNVSDDLELDKEESTEPPISSSQVVLNESNTETLDTQEKKQTTVPENIEIDNGRNKDVSFEIIKPQELMVDAPHFKDSEEQPAPMPEELRVEDDETHNTTKSRHSKKIDSIKPIESRDVNLKNLSDVNNKENYLIEHFYSQWKKLPNKTDYSIDVDDGGKRAVSLETLNHQEPIPEAPPVEHGSAQVGLNIGDADDGRRPVSFDVFKPEQPLPKPPSVEHGSIQVGLHCYHLKESGGCINDDGRRPVSFDVFKPEQPIPEPPLVEHGSTQEGLDSTINKQTDKPNNNKQDSAQTITTTEVSTTREALTEVSNAGGPTTGVSSTIVSTTEVSNKGGPTTVVSSARVSTTEVTSAGGPTTEVSSARVSTAEVTSAGGPTTEVSSARVSTAEVTSAGGPTTEVSSARVSTTEVTSAGGSTTKVSSAGVSTAGTSPKQVSSVGVSTTVESSTDSYDSFLSSIAIILKDKKRKDVLPDIGTA